MKILAIIPAREGSKRLPGKNIKLLNGKPLIQWTIDSALSVNEIDTVMVSTDSQEIADIALKHGAKVPFIRPKKLATDTSSSFDVIRHTLDYYAGKGELYDFLILLQPTSPARNGEDIKQAIKLLLLKAADAVVSVSECKHPPLWSNTIPENLSLQGFIDSDIKQKRSQDLPTYYRLNGAIYLVKVSRFYEEKTLFISSNIFAHVMNDQKSIDIDHEIDFMLAEVVMKSKEVYV